MGAEAPSEKELHCFDFIGAGNHNKSEGGDQVSKHHAYQEDTITAIRSRCKDHSCRRQPPGAGLKEWVRIRPWSCLWDLGWSRWPNGWHRKVVRIRPLPRASVTIPTSLGQDAGNTIQGGSVGAGWAKFVRWAASRGVGGGWLLGGEMHQHLHL